MVNHYLCISCIREQRNISGWPIDNDDMERVTWWREGHCDACGYWTNISNAIDYNVFDIKYRSEQLAAMKDMENE
jgi:hypothetical protein